MTFQDYQVFSKRSVVLRSLVIGMDERLQNEARDVFGRIISPVQHAVETTKADGLRAEVISYFMYNVYTLYKSYIYMFICFNELSYTHTCTILFG